MVTTMDLEKFLSGAVGESNPPVEELMRRSRKQFERMLKPMRRPEVAIGVVNSPLGDLLVALGAQGIVLIHYLLGGDLESTVAKLRLTLDPVEDRRSVTAVGAEIRCYLDGDPDALRSRVDLTLATSPFQKKVFGKLQEVPRGAVVSYRALGAAAGAPKAARAIGNVMHNNPVPIYVPCHRVIASGGGLGGYGGGLSRKLRLLRSEGFTLGNAAKSLPVSVVWGHKDTKIYCRSGCPAVQRANSARIIFFADSAQAKTAGLRPCKVCRPAL
jgi:O-6-methylguanine DNA methyltransferase